VADDYAPTSLASDECVGEADVDGEGLSGGRPSQRGDALDNSRVTVDARRHVVVVEHVIVRLTGLNFGDRLRTRLDD